MIEHLITCTDVNAASSLSAEIANENGEWKGVLRLRGVNGEIVKVLATHRFDKALREKLNHRWQVETVTLATPAPKAA